MSSQSPITLEQIRTVISQYERLIQENPKAVLLNETLSFWKEKEEKLLKQKNPQ